MPLRANLCKNLTVTVNQAHSGTFLWLWRSQDYPGAEGLAGCTGRDRNVPHFFSSGTDETHSWPPTQHWHNTTPCLFFWTMILTHFYYWQCAKGGKNYITDKNNSCFMRDTSSCRMLLYLTQQQFHRHEHNRYFPELFISHYPAASQRVRENTNVETRSVQDFINIYG